MINPVQDLAQSAVHFSRHPRDQFYLIKLLLVTIGLIVGALLLNHEASAQIQIADENTELPDYKAYETGLDAAYAGDYVTALREFTVAADAGLHLAQYNLGVMYYTGEGVDQDYELAFKWTRMAAEQGHINAQFNLGTMFYNGLGMRSSLFTRWPLSLIYRQSNFEEAVKWYGYAAEYDHGEAQYNLATMYENGEGVAQDLIKAYVWARLAYDNEVPDATLLYNSLNSRLTAEQRDEAGRAYAQWVLEFRG
ncbi:MAG: tetratricopeptide repeat protein [Pseudohongiella sp.]|nr:tetratricopeptide repeat protein [Pseudohongiella sp.]MDP2283201.1 tetratricopeptide repeat protein [Pseudohongiella sp.]